MLLEDPVKELFVLGIPQGGELEEGEGGEVGRRELSEEMVAPSSRASNRSSQSRIRVLRATICSPSGSGCASSASIWLGGTLQTSLNHSRKTSIWARAAGSEGNIGGSG